MVILFKATGIMLMKTGSFKIAYLLTKFRSESYSVPDFVRR